MIKRAYFLLLRFQLMRIVLVTTLNHLFHEFRIRRTWGLLLFTKYIFSLQIQHKPYWIGRMRMTDEYCEEMRWFNHLLFAYSSREIHSIVAQMVLHYFYRPTARSDCFPYKHLKRKKELPLPETTLPWRLATWPMFVCGIDRSKWTNTARVQQPSSQQVWRWHQ